MACVGLYLAINSHNNNMCALVSIEEKEPQRHPCAKILHCYEPQTPVELCLHEIGAIITEVVPLEHGWCKV